MVDDKRTFSIRLAPELMKQIKILAIKKEVSFGKLFEEAIKDLLKKYKTSI